MQQLPRVVAPAGGLVPYRRGQRWGYADTTGRVVVEPVLLAAPPFSAAGFVRVDAYFDSGSERELLRDFKYDDKCPDFEDVSQPQVRLFVNARGEFMRVKANEAALIQPDGSLLLRPRYADANAGQLELLDVSPAVGVVEQLEWDTPKNQLTTRRMGTAAFERRLTRGATELEYPAAPDRWAYADYQRVYGNIRIYGRCGSFRDHKGWRRELTKMALMDEKGRLLTGYRYRSIGDFQNGLAVVLGADRRKQGYGLLDRQGREVLPTRYTQVSVGVTGGAVVQQASDGAHGGQSRYGIVNQQGEWVLPLQADKLSAPDAHGLVRRLHTDKTVEFLTMQGQPAFESALKLREAEGFWQGRAWALTDAGPGLLDAHGRWVVAPGRYDLLQDIYNESRHLGRELTLRDGSSGREGNDLLSFSPSWPMAKKLSGSTAADYQHPDSSYLIVRRAGLYGLVSRATGREVLPCRYDRLTSWVGDYGCGVRNNQSFLLTARGGRELAAGMYNGEWYNLPGRGPMFQVYLSPHRWLVVDSSGRPATALLPSERGMCFLTPEKLVLLSQEGKGGSYATAQAIADTTGRVLVSYGGAIEYSGRPSWLNTVYYWGSSRERPATFSHAFVVDQPDGKHLWLARNGRVRDATGHAYHNLKLLAGGWHLTRRDSRSVLISPEGVEIFAPQNYEWDETLHQKDRVVPFANGTASVAESGYHRPVVQGKGGLVTRGGRRLWED
ncbi:hypothetical protein GCM10023185_08060 [Hymenobacter saemangeumensis]|uniref:WG repeat-containing protein n=1 Tax=Hymenobacter saemangeumensis TaxID=1084522 RepID=A0ABP8I309_9BACT